MVETWVRHRTNRAHEPSFDTPHAVERGGWIAVGICILALGMLRVPLGHSGTLDVTLLHAVNAIMARVPFIGVQTVLLDQDVPQLVIAAAAVALWFRKPASERFRSRILIAFMAFFPTYALARMAQHMDHRLRPLVDQPLQSIGDPAVFHAVKGDMTHWGSFPSDHAALLAIATVVAFMVGRRPGLIALALAAYSCLFRIGYGYHWPSDIAGGAILGTVVILALMRWRHAMQPLLDQVFGFIEKRSALAAALGAVIVVEFSGSFRYSQMLVSLALHTRLFH